MVLENVTLDPNDLQELSVASLIVDNTLLHQTTGLFLKQKPTVINTGQACLAVIESECAMVRRKNLTRNSPRIIGSDWATTCVIVIFESDTFVVCAHIADPRTVTHILGAGVSKLKNFDPNSGTINVYLVGGFTDGKPTSNVSLMSCHICCEILIFLWNSKINFNLKLMACYDVNSSSENKPIHMGVAYCLETSRVFPSNLQNCFGPDIELRRASLGKVMITSEYNLLFEPEEEMLQIDPFEVSISQKDLRHWIKFSDEIILKFFSTSPAAEPEGFAEAFRKKCQFLLSNMTGGKSVFVDDKPRIHQLDAEAGVWNLLG